MLYSYNNEYPVTFDQIPSRIRLSNRLTKTDKSTFTEEDLIDAGYIPVSDAPNNIDTHTQKVLWSGTEWQIIPLTDQEKLDIKNEKWAEIRKVRDNLIQDIIWRVQRYQSEVRLGVEPTDNIVALDQYIQALRDITKQEDPFNIVWPNYWQYTPTSNGQDQISITNNTSEEFL